MNSNQMKDCLVLNNFKPESKEERDKISFKNNQIYLKDLPLISRTYEAPRYDGEQKQVGIKPGKYHKVGQLDNNIKKIKQVLDKTAFVDKILITDLEQGQPSAFLKIIHHLLFKASSKFTSTLFKSQQSKVQQTNFVSPDIEYLPDQQFFKQICLILCDLFSYRVDITHPQFFTTPGYAEKKLILCLDIYEIVQKVISTVKINEKLSSEVGKDVIFASDEALKNYQVIDHQNQVKKTIVFKVNTQLQKRQLTTVEQQDISYDMGVQQEQDNKSFQQINQMSDNQKEYVPLRGNKSMVIMGASKVSGLPQRQFFSPHIGGATNDLSRLVPNSYYKEGALAIIDENINSEFAEGAAQAEQHYDDRLQTIKTGDNLGFKSQISSDQMIPLGVKQGDEVSVRSGTSSVYSLSRQHERKTKKKQKKIQESISEKKESLQENQAQLSNEQKNQGDRQDIEMLQVVSECIQSLSSKYEVMGKKLNDKLDKLEQNSKQLTGRVDMLQQELYH